MTAPQETFKLAQDVAGQSLGAAPCSPSRFHVDLFSGIGGFAIAAQRAGIKTIGFAEIDTYATKVLKRHWPNVTNFGDVRNITAESISVPVFVLTGGFPCQPFSEAGKQAGREDDRYLWPEMFRVIKALRPAWVLGENVPPLIKLALDQVLDDLESAGYSTQSFVVPAGAVGARHRRDRVWILAHSAGEHGNQSVFERPADKWARPSSDGSELRADTSDDSGWTPEPTICRVDDGIPHRVDRNRGLGNAIVPEIAFRFFSMMIESERTWMENAEVSDASDAFAAPLGSSVRSTTYKQSKEK
jgi:DNA (cytosine-5)-methyltransferase 1